jgi:hypothetical protein
MKLGCEVGLRSFFVITGWPHCTAQSRRIPYNIVLHLSWFADGEHTWYNGRALPRRAKGRSLSKQSLPLFAKSMCAQNALRPPSEGISCTHRAEFCRDVCSSTGFKALKGTIVHTSILQKDLIRHKANASSIPKTKHPLANQCQRMP